LFAATPPPLPFLVYFLPVARTFKDACLFVGVRSFYRVCLVLLVGLGHSFIHRISAPFSFHCCCVFVSQRCAVVFISCLVSICPAFVLSSSSSCLADGFDERLVAGWISLLLLVLVFVVVVVVVVVLNGPCWFMMC